jgi:hypothetical protein
MSGGALPGVGKFSYNGLEMVGPMVSSKVSFQPVRDDADRTVTHHNVSIQIHGTFQISYCGQTTDALNLAGTNFLLDIEKIRMMLAQDGKPLIFEDKVFKKFHVNTGTSDAYNLVDVAYGPRVEVTSIEPIMSNRAFEIVMSITCAVGVCPELNGAGAPSGGIAKSWSIGDIKQVVYTVAWSGDHRGYSTRVVDGFMEIVQCPSLQPFPGILTLTADDYRELMTVSLPEGFRRIGNDYTLNERKDRVKFSIRDEEIASPNAFPPDVVDISIQHTVAVGAQNAFHKAMSTLSGYCEVANPYGSALAWERVFPIIAGRINAARSQSGGIFLSEIRITEDIYSRSVSFSISYYKLGTSPAGFLSAAAMFTPTTDVWSGWRASMYGPDESTNEAGLPFSRRSVANLSYEPSDDIIVTPCTSQPFTIFVHNQRVSPFPSSLLSVLTNICPPVNKSYRSYVNKLRSTVRGGAATFTEMPTGSTSYTPRVPKTSDGTELSSAVNADSFTGRSIDSTVNAPTVEMVLEGHGDRLGYPVELPSISKNWSAAVQKIPNGSVIETTSRMFLGCRLYVAKWSLRYKIAKSLVDAAADLGDLTSQLFVTPSYPAGDQADVG